ncbi:uncharacterized protein B0J16DRAFT_345474 [Fusarium flagelliforme]|uniref:uncharacterized protein n=1 Tax=Fusarium flagelliforme TaxID=2675880 RepID=UPI001E8E9A04|nr:uncharacterized protein B0J16DRAFT_345474 [Fusarium flagelliforme]KAH7183152.1 hypothetical protein B0J16DRAFT_345474 [Fusarium flagelliforme]
MFEAMCRLVSSRLRPYAVTLEAQIRSIEMRAQSEKKCDRWVSNKRKRGNSQAKSNEALTTETETETGICSIFQTYLDNKIIAFLSNPQMVRMG